MKCTCHPDDNPPQPCVERYALNECRAAAMKRTPPRMGRYEEAGLVLSETSNGIYVHFIPVGRNRGCTLTAEQAREAAHLLNQLAEYLETC